MSDIGDELLEQAKPALADLAAVIDKHAVGESVGVMLALALHLESLCQICEVYSDDFVAAAERLIEEGKVAVPKPTRLLGTGTGSGKGGGE